MQSFTAKYSDKIQGVLSGFDRLIFRGSLRKIAYTFGLNSYLWANHVLLKDFGSHANEISERVKTAALRCVQESGRRIQYLQSSKDNKEEIARSIARQDHITEGPVCALTCVEPCLGFDIHRNRETKRLELVQRPRKCLYVYQYWEHPVLGWLHARIQTWFPFSIQIGMNGREWLARQMDGAGIDYQRQDNCFPWVSNWDEAQRLLDTQLKADWPKVLDEIAGALNAIHNEIFQRFPMHYYWATYQSEWATDIVFKAAEDLRRLYPLLVHHAMTTFSSPDVLRFLGKQFTAAGHINGHVKAEVTSDLKRRQEGVRIKHRYGDNSVKLYDKAYTSLGSVLRAELTMQRPEEFQVYRRIEGSPKGPLMWLPMRRGIADLHRRAEGMCCNFSWTRTDSLEGDPQWPSDQQFSNGDNPSPRSFFVRYGGIFGTRCLTGMSRNSWRSAVWKRTIPPYGAGSSVMLPNSTNGCDAISNRPTSRGESTRHT